jgi:hypothetical protein
MAMGYKTRFVVRWTDEKGALRTETFEGRGAYVASIAFRDRLPDDSGAHLVREALQPVWTWVDIGLVTDLSPSQRSRVRKATGSGD